MNMTVQQYEKEIKKLEMSNRALKRELGWFKSLVNRFYPSVIFLIASFVYFSLIEEETIAYSIGRTILYTILFILADLIIGRIVRKVWENRQK